MRDGDPCPDCGKPVRLAQGIEVGNIFKLGTDFTVALGATYLAEDGSRGTTRSWARTASGSDGRWPASSRRITTTRASGGRRRWPRIGRTWWPSAPHGILPWPRQPTGSTHRLTDAGVAVLYDDRDESPGVKFTDAELLGMPTIVTVSPRSLAAGGVEVTDRASGERSVRPDRRSRGRAQRHRMSEAAYPTATRSSRIGSTSTRSSSWSVAGDAPAMSEEELDRLQVEHLTYLRGLKREGVLIANGPLAEQTDERMRGLSVYALALDEALALARADPMVRAGRLEIHGARWWTARAGARLTLAGCEAASSLDGHWLRGHGTLTHRPGCPTVEAAGDRLDYDRQPGSCGEDLSRLRAHCGDVGRDPLEPGRVGHAAHG